jgi:uncharacterized membrane protein
MKSKAEKQKQFAEALGWFSVALGFSELLLPGGLATLIGVKRSPKLMRFLGLRELSSGIGILSRPKTAGWLWSRVAGDAMDLALLGAALASPKSKQRRVLAATAAVAGVTALDYLCSQNLSRNGHSMPGEMGKSPGGTLFSKRSRAIHYKKTMAIDRSPEDLYKYWRDFENLPRFMYHLRAVQASDGTRSHWIANAPAGSKVEWDAEITEDKPNELIVWRSAGGDVENSGQVRFTPAPGGRGTFVSVDIEYKPPGGKIGAAFAKLFREEPGMQIEDSLRSFKQIMETGEVATTKGQPAGRATSTSKKFDYPVRTAALSGSPA